MGRYGADLTFLRPFFNLQALTMDALQRVDGVDPATVKAAMRSYVKWVSAMQARAGATVDAHTEPKWVISTGQPYAGGWCRPQTDGPGLRARALMRYAGTALSGPIFTI